MTVVPIHAGLSGLADDYDCFVVDLWGVLHDGVRAFPAAVDCLAELKARGKRILILSNAPRRAASVAQRNLELGIAPELADLVMSSGEAAWRHLKTRSDPWYGALGRRCYHLGPDRDLGMRAGLDYDFVDDLKRADFILNTGVLSAEHGVEAYGDLLREAKALDLPMVCANPDLEVVRGGKREICAGAVAVYYEEFGGRVRYHGKPDREIYDICFELLGQGRRERVVAIGDSLRTDIAGARNAGIDGIFIGGGIHADALGLVDGAPLDPVRLAGLCDLRGLYPAAALSVLRW